MPFLHFPDFSPKSPYIAFHSLWPIWELNSWIPFSPLEDQFYSLLTQAQHLYYYYSLHPKPIYLHFWMFICVLNRILLMLLLMICSMILWWLGITIVLLYPIFGVLLSYFRWKCFLNRIQHRWCIRGWAGNHRR